MKHPEPWMGTYVSLAGRYERTGFWEVQSVDKESGMELGIGRSLNLAPPFCPLEKQVDAELCGGGQVYQVGWLLGQPACFHSFRQDLSTLLKLFSNSQLLFLGLS